MHRNKGSVLILLLILCLGIFFQNQRNDGLLRMFRNTNAVLAVNEVKMQPAGSENWSKEQFLLVYDAVSGDSIRLVFNIEKVLKHLKKDVKLVPVGELAKEKLEYSGVILAFANLDRITDFGALQNYVSNGGKVYFMTTPAEGNVFTAIKTELGIKNTGGIVNTPGIKILSDILIQGKGFEMEGDSIDNVSFQVDLDEKARLHISSYEGIPLLWDRVYGKGAFISYNGTMLHEKNSRGIITGMLGLDRDSFVYPVIGAKIMYIDDFPAPVPEGTSEVIYPDYHLTNPEFYRQIWWPDMLKLAERYDIKYTGVAIETYTNHVKPPFMPEENNETNRTNLILYGRELFKSGGEMGIHGYNHQSLAPQGFARHIDYKPWDSQEDMTESLKEIKRYLGDVYPDYRLKVYVPPSNILSPEGRKALVQALPDLKVIASLYIGSYEEDDSYVQEYGKGQDGVLNMPRLSSNYLRTKDNDWSILNGISFLGVFCHFVHPDNIFYPENKGRHWEEFYKGIESLLKDLQEKYSWLRAATASQAAEYFEDFLQMDYRVTTAENQLNIACWGFRDNSYFILRTPRKIAGAAGCEVQQIDENIYLLKIHSSEVKINF